MQRSHDSLRSNVHGSSSGSHYRECDALDCECGVADYFFFFAGFLPSTSSSASR